MEEQTTETLFSPEDIARELRRLAAEIQARMGTEEPVMVLALMNGALWFAADLLRLLPANYILETARVSSYGNELCSSGHLEWLSQVPSCAGKRVLVLDDVLDTGVTLAAVKEALLDHGAREVLTAVAVDKKVTRCVPIKADFTALEAPNRYLFGYGMDVEGRYRNIPSIGCL